MDKYDEKFAEWRGIVNTTLDTVNKNSDILFKKIQHVEEDLRQHQLQCENRFSYLEANQRLLLKLAIGGILAGISAFITIIVKVAT